MTPPDPALVAAVHQKIAPVITSHIMRHVFSEHELASDLATLVASWLGPLSRLERAVTVYEADPGSLCIPGTPVETNLSALLRCIHEALAVLPRREETR